MKETRKKRARKTGKCVRDGRKRINKDRKVKEMQKFYVICIFLSSSDYGDK